MNEPAQTKITYLSERIAIKQQNCNRIQKRS